MSIIPGASAVSDNCSTIGTSAYHSLTSTIGTSQPNASHSIVSSSSCSTSQTSAFVPSTHVKSHTTVGTKPAVHKVLFGGDQLTAARARGCRDLRLNSNSITGQLQGLLPVAEDWHTMATLLSVCKRVPFKLIFVPNS